MPNVSSGMGVIVGVGAGVRDSSDITRVLIGDGLTVGRWVGKIRPVCSSVASSDDEDGAG